MARRTMTSNIPGTALLKPVQETTLNKVHGNFRVHQHLVTVKVL